MGRPAGAAAPCIARVLAALLLVTVSAPPAQADAAGHVRADGIVSLNVWRALKTATAEELVSRLSTDDQGCLLVALHQGTGCQPVLAALDATIVRAGGMVEAYSIAVNSSNPTQQALGLTVPGLLEAAAPDCTATGLLTPYQGGGRGSVGAWKRLGSPGTAWYMGDGQALLFGRVQ